MNEKEYIEDLKKLHRLTNYISTAMLYLRNNFFLEKEFEKEDIKKRILGHWGTVPGLNLIYGGLNIILKQRKQKILLVAGPGHGAPAILSNEFIEGTISEFYSDYSYDLDGLKKFIKNFSWPGGFPSHTSPMVPGTILEGGELGYSLALSYGSVMDNPDLVTVCVVGDGEAETATLAASWHANKFINPNKDGVVLPILHLNGYRISGPTIYGTMSDSELKDYFNGLGYDPIFVDQYSSNDIYKEFIEALNKCFDSIDETKAGWREYKIDKPRWPVLILKTMKGWSGPAEVNGKMIEDNNLSHGIPLQNPLNNEIEFTKLKEWLESYNVKELINEDQFSKDILNLIPEDEFKLGRVSMQLKSESLILPKIEDNVISNFTRGERQKSRMEEFSEYLRDLLDLNSSKNNFRIFSPDESESNLLLDIFSEASRAYIWPVREQDEYISNEGRVIEMLSENVLTEMMKGYTLTNRHGILISYEAFLNIVSSQIDQHLKYLKSSSEIRWRRSIPSLNFVATSTLWRQEHNGYTHQNPTLINSLLSKKSDQVRIYFPSDPNILMEVANKILSSYDLVNLVVSCKRSLPIWLYPDEAKILVEKGISVWNWVGNDDSSECDVVLASCGEYQTLETIAAVDLLNDLIPELKIRYVNVNEVSYKGLGSFDSPVVSDEDISNYFSKDKDVIFNFHGYPSAIEQVVFGTSLASRIKVFGYIEQGTTTTPFDMQVLNKTSRYHICIEAIKSASKYNSTVESEKDILINYFESKLKKHSSYIKENSDDMPEIKNWQWVR